MAGRRKGARQWPGDEALLWRMACLVETGRAKGYREASHQLKHEADGPADPASKAKRLQRGYQARPELREEVRRLLKARADALHIARELELDAALLRGGLGSIRTIATGLDHIASADALLAGSDPAAARLCDELARSHQDIEDAERRLWRDLEAAARIDVPARRN